MTSDEPQENPAFQAGLYDIPPRGHVEPLSNGSASSAPHYLSI